MRRKLTTSERYRIQASSCLARATIDAIERGDPKVPEPDAGAMADAAEPKP